MKVSPIDQQTLKLFKMIRFLLLTLLLVFNQTCADAYHQNNEHYDVIVVGAGISGLRSAAVLKENGMNVLVIEASDRIGGRIWTKNPWGTTLELGASWIHGIENNPVFDIARDMHEPIQPTIYNDQNLIYKLKSISLYDFQGKKLSKEKLNELEWLSLKFTDYLAQQANLKSPIKTSIFDAFLKFYKESKISDEKMVQLFQLSRILYSNEYAADLQDISILEHDVFCEDEAMGTNAFMPSGYNLITSKIARNLSIKLNCQALAIHLDDKGVCCRTNDGLFESQYIVVTVPLGVLKSQDITFSPPLPEEKINAINTLQMGLFNKIYLFFPYTFWDNSEWIGWLPSRESDDMQFDVLNLQRYSKQPVLLGFVSGDYAKKLEGWSDVEIVDSYMDILRKIYGADIPSPSAHLITRWGQNPYSYGSYSYLPPVMPGETPYKGMKDPVDNKLFFAGEASSQHAPSTVYGAFMRGEEVAKEILELSGREIQTP